MRLLTLDTSCVLNLLNPDEAVDEDLLRILRMAVSSRVRLAVTHVADAELSQAKAGMRERLRQYPQLTVDPAKEDERRRQASEMLKVLWPKASEKSKKYEHHLRDCLHLVAHAMCGGDVFVTRDEDLARKAGRHHEELGIRVLKPAAALAELEPVHDANPTKRALTTSVRAALDDDYSEIARVLEPIQSLYPDFSGWLRKAMRDPGASVLVGLVDKSIAAVSISKRKDNRVVKLSTIFVADEHRGSGIGSHLLFHELRHWVASRYEKAYVSVTSANAYLVPFFLRFGMKIEGVSLRRYTADQPELILAKHLMYRVVDDASSLELAEEVVSTVFAPPLEKNLGRDAWFQPPENAHLSGSWEGSGDDATLLLKRPDGSTQRKLTIGDLEMLFHPMRCAFAGRKAYLIPIRPEWADQMVQYPRKQLRVFEPPSDRLLLRTDNAYYCYPRYADRSLVGAPAVFYVSHEDKAFVGTARILDRAIASPEELFVKFADMGVYSLEDIRQHVSNRGTVAGSAMALKFGWWVPFASPITLKHAKKELGLQHPQTLTAIDYPLYEQILAEGGIQW